MRLTSLFMCLKTVLVNFSCCDEVTWPRADCTRVVFCFLVSFLIFFFLSSSSLFPPFFACFQIHESIMVGRHGRHGRQNQRGQQEQESEKSYFNSTKEAEKENRKYGKDLNSHHHQWLTSSCNAQCLKGFTASTNSAVIVHYVILLFTTNVFSQQLTLIRVILMNLWNTVGFLILKNSDLTVEILFDHT